MAGRKVSVKDRIEKDKVKQDSLFNSTTDSIQERMEINDKQGNNKTSKLVNNKTEKQSDTLKRQTYFLTEELIQGIAFKSVFEKRDKSDIVREALRAYIEDKYLNMEQ